MVPLEISEAIDFRKGARNADFLENVFKIAYQAVVFVQCFVERNNLQNTRLAVWVLEKKDFGEGGLSQFTYARSRQLLSYVLREIEDIVLYAELLEKVKAANGFGSDFGVLLRGGGDESIGGGGGGSGGEVAVVEGVPIVGSVGIVRDADPASSSRRTILLGRAFARGLVACLLWAEPVDDALDEPADSVGVCLGGLVCCLLCRVAEGRAAGDVASAVPEMSARRLAGL